MSHDTKQTLFSTEPASGGSEPNHGAPALKAWVTPKVITSTLAEDTELNASNHVDGASIVS